MKLIECPHCGAPLHPRSGRHWVRCRYCGWTTHLRPGHGVAARPVAPVPRPRPRPAPAAAGPVQLPVQLPGVGAVDPAAVLLWMGLTIALGGTAMTVLALAFGGGSDVPPSGTAVLDGTGGSTSFEGTLRFSWHEGDTDVDLPPCRGEIPDRPHVVLDVREPVDLTAAASGSGGLLVSIVTDGQTAFCGDGARGDWPRVTARLEPGLHHIHVGRTDDGPAEASFRLNVSWADVAANAN